MKTYQRLSASLIKRTTPAADKDIWLSDSIGARGIGRLVLRITPRGVRRFYFRYSASGQRKTVPLGLYARNRANGYLTLSQARDAAGALMASVQLSTHSTTPRLASAPVRQVSANSGDRVEATAPIGSTSASDGVSLTLLELCQAYIRRLERDGKSSAMDNHCIVRLHVASSELAKKLARDVKALEIAGLLREVVKSGKGRTAGKIRSILHAAYASAIDAKLNPTATEDQIDNTIETNPVTPIPALSKFNKARHRVLNKSELRELWKRLNRPDAGSTDTAHRAARLTVRLGGQRCEQLLRVVLTDVNLDASTVLLHDGKGNREEARKHLLPLTPAAKQEVAWLVQHSRDLGSASLFASHVKGVTLNPGTVSKLIRDICRDMRQAGLAESQFQYSDIRRTIETTLASLDVPVGHRAQVQSHGISGVQAKHYDMYEYMPEKLHALMIWDKYLSDLMAG